MAFQIRELSEPDWPGFRWIYKQGIDTGLATLQPDCPSWDEWDKAHLKCCRLVVTGDNTVIGWAALSPVSSRCVYSGVAEVSVYIAPEYWGQGVGCALLMELIRRSEEEGFWTLQSSILRENLSSVRLHERCGFRLVGYRERIGRDRDGRWRDTLLMERRCNNDEVSSINEHKAD